MSKLLQYEVVFKHHAIITVVLLIISIGVLLQLHATQFNHRTDTDQALESTTILGVNSANSFDTDVLYTLINAHRKEHSLAPLQVHPSLEVSAERKVGDMIEHEYFAHDDQLKRKSWYFFKEAGYEYTVAGENLAFNVNTPWQVLTAWSESAKHNEEMLNAQYVDMGIAADCQKTARATQNCIIVLHLGKQ